MKKLLSIAILGSILTLSTSYTALAANQTAKVERGTISVNTSANTEIMPDIVEINLAVKTYDTKSLQNATNENKEISEKVYNKLTSMINKENGDYVKTSNFSAEPLYKYNGSKRTLDKYQVSNNIIVRTKSIKDVGKMIDTAIALGATDINDLTFSISNYDKQCNDLLTIATQKATTRANMMTKASSSTIDGIKYLNGSCSTNENNKVQYRLFAKNAAYEDSVSGAQETTSIPIQSGTIKIFANVNAEFFVK